MLYYTDYINEYFSNLQKDYLVTYATKAHLNKEKVLSTEELIDSEDAKEEANLNNEDNVNDEVSLNLINILM